MRKVIEGSHAVAEAVKLCKPLVVAAYPITPQTHIVERIADFVADGDMKCEYVPVESEFAALSVVQGASARGVRVYSSTSSQGLALMHEALHATSGLRLPVVMNVANRALSAPINIWNDQSDSMAQRDTGWLQFYVENAQEAFDHTVIAYRVAEDPRVSLPAMVGMDGFILTHSVEPADIPSQAQVDKFLPPFKPNIRLDPDAPLTIGPIAFPDSYMEMKYDQQQVTLDSLKVIEQSNKEFGKVFGRKYSPVETYNLDKSDTAILAIGSVVGTLKDFSDKNKVGVIHLRLFRPFPIELLKKTLAKVNKLIVLEKAVSYGSYAPVFTEVATAMYGSGMKLQSSICGLGGRDVTFNHIKAALGGKQWLL